MRVIALFVLLTAVAAWAQPTGLLLHAPFDGTGDAALAVGDGRQQGGLLTFGEGLRGKAVALNTDCAFPVGGNFRPEAGTLAAWLRPQWDGDSPVGHYLFCLYGQRDVPESWAHNRFCVEFSGGQCRFTVYPATGPNLGVAGAMRDWKANEWHHVAITWASINSGQPNAELRLYLDGKLAGELTGKQIAVGATNEVMAIGRDQDGSPDYGEADLDDLFIYDRALTAEEVTQGVQQARSLPVEATAPAPAAAQAVPGWWNAAWPYRVPVFLPPAETERRHVSMECAVKPNLSGLGIAGTVDMASIRVVGDRISADPANPVLPCRVEDDLVQWQGPGVVPAGSARLYWLYFRTIAYSFPGLLVSQRVATPGDGVANSPPIPDYATATTGKGWDFDDGSFSGIDQWGNKPEYLRDRKVANGILSFDVTQDPWFIWGDMWGQVNATNQKVAIDLSKYPVLEMKVRQSVASAKWELYGRVGNSTALMHYDWIVSGTGWQRLRIDLRQDARWSGVLSALRIDPTQDIANAHIEFDWVRLLAVTPVEHEAVETPGNPSSTPKTVAVSVPQKQAVVGSSQPVTVTIKDAAGKPVSGQPILVSLPRGSEAQLQRAPEQASLAASIWRQRGLTDASGQLRLLCRVSRRAAADDTITAEASFTAVPTVSATMRTIAGPPHHYRVEPAKVLALKQTLPLTVSAQLVDEFDNPVAAPRKLTWSTDAPSKLTGAVASLDTKGKAAATWRGDESQRWVYHVRVTDDKGMSGESAAICLLPTKPRTDPIVIGQHGYFLKGKGGKPWLPLGGFYANWVGLPEGGEEGRRLISFVDATEEQLSHWLEFLASQGVTGLRFMLRAHTPKGMEPMDVIGRVNMPLFARVLRYMDLARQHDIRFMLVIHEDYTKPAYYNQQALETFCLPQYAGENLDALPPFQRRFIRDRKLIGIIGEKYTDPDVMACQDQYTRELIGLLRDNPQLFSWEFENEMVDCPQSWAQHMAQVIRDADPVTPICASHGGGGLHTGDPLWWTKNSGIDFYTYHLYPHRGSTSAEVDFGAAADVLTTYGRMAGMCMFGETAGDEFSYYPKERDADRRYLMRDLIWFPLVNGNPGCFFWNARGFEVEQFRLANKIMSTLDLSHWQRMPGSAAINVSHPLDDDKYYRTKEGMSDYWRLGELVQLYRSQHGSFDFTMHASAPPAPGGPATGYAVTPGWQIAAMQDQTGQGLAYVRNFAGVRQWTVPSKCDMFLRDRKPAPLTLTLRLGEGRSMVTATDLDTGEEKRVELPRNGQLDLGTTEHDWAVVWKTAP